MCHLIWPVLIWPVLICLDYGGLDAGSLDAVCHSLGNPHAVVFVDDAERVDIERIGPLVETASLFPDRVNLSGGQPP